MRAALPPPERQEHGRLLVVVNLTVVKYLPPVWQERALRREQYRVWVVSPFVGMAGRHTASPIPHASPRRRRCFVGYGRKSPPHSRQLPEQSRAAPPPGTAGTVSAAGHEAHSVTSGASPSGTAGTRRPGGTGRTPAKAQTPPAATAGTAPQRADAPPGVNHGTRRMKGAMPPTPGGTGKSPKPGRKGGEP